MPSSRVVGEIEAEGRPRAIGVMADVGSPADVNRMVAEATTAFGKVDIAISNVGLRVIQDFLTITPEMNRVLNANLNASFYMAQACLPGMIERKWGRLIHVSGNDGVQCRELHPRPQHRGQGEGAHAGPRAVQRLLRSMA